MAKRKTDKIAAEKPEAEAPQGSDIAGVYTEIRFALMRFASRFLRKPQDIEDVVQEACVKALEAQNQRRIDHPKAYLYRATKNLALKQLAKSAYRLTDSVGDFDELTVIDSDQTIESEFESRQKFELFCRAVRQLPLVRKPNSPGVSFLSPRHPYPRPSAPLCRSKHPVYLFSSADTKNSKPWLYMSEEEAVTKPFRSNKKYCGNPPNP